MLPGADPAASWNAGSAWRAVVWTDTGDQAPEQVLAGIRMSPLMSRGDRSFVVAMADSTLDRLLELANTPGDPQHPAMVALALRGADAAPPQTVDTLTALLALEDEPWNHKLLRKYLPGLHVCAILAPGVRAIMPLDGAALALLKADLLMTLSRPVEAVAALEVAPMNGAVGIALAGAYLATGRSASVIKLTDHLNNVDDLSALGFVARSVALRTLGRDEEALMALDRALAAPNRDAGVLAAALEERAALLGSAGEDLAARADLERLHEIDGIPEGGPAGPMPGMPAPEEHLTPEEQNERMKGARARVRRQLRGTGNPGTFGGRHHTTYTSEVQAMLATGLLPAAESLLLGLMDAVEDEAAELGIGVDGTYYLTLADLFAANGEVAAQAAVIERYQQACARYGVRQQDGAVPAAPVAAAAAVGPQPVAVAPVGAPAIDPGTDAVEDPAPQAGEPTTPEPLTDAPTSEPVSAVAPAVETAEAAPLPSEESTPTSTPSPVAAEAAPEPGAVAEAALGDQTLTARRVPEPPSAESSSTEAPAPTPYQFPVSGPTDRLRGTARSLSNRPDPVARAVAEAITESASASAGAPADASEAPGTGDPTADDDTTAKEAQEGPGTTSDSEPAILTP